MGVTFDDDVDFFDICEELDPDLTHRIQFDKLIAKLTEPQSESDEEMESLMEDIEKD